MNEYLTLANCCELVHEVFQKLDCDELVGKIEVSFNKRFTSRMGDANYSKKRIRLSSPLWARASKEQRHQTIVHEACHIVQYHKYGRKKGNSAHGVIWKALMRRVGVKPNRLHSVKPIRRKGHRHKAKCGCKEWLLSSTRVNKMKRGMYYTCQACKEKLILLG